MLEFIAQMNSIPLSSEFVEKKMPLANGAYVKVYLYTLYLAYRGISEDTADIAKKLELLESDVVNALDYWKNEGVITANNNYIYFNDQTEDIKKPQLKKKTFKNVSELIMNNKALSDLCTLSQEVLGKTLNNSDLETLYWFYDELGFSPEVIIMLLEYCVSKDKRNMKYIEKVAIGWHENGITTMSQVDSYIKSEKEKNTYLYSLRKLFGITDRNLSKSEELYLKTWKNDYEMSEEMIALAYEYCILSTNKLSFPYINSIVKGWYERGIKTIDEAEKDHNEYKAKTFNNNEQNVYNSGVDYDKFIDSNKKNP